MGLYHVTRHVPRLSRDRSSHGGDRRQKRRAEAAEYKRVSRPHSLDIFLFFYLVFQGRDRLFSPRLFQCL